MQSAGAPPSAREEGGRRRDRRPAPAPRCHHRHGALCGFVLQPWMVRVCPDNRATGAQCSLAALGMKPQFPGPRHRGFYCQHIKLAGGHAAASGGGSAQGTEHGRPCHGQRGGPGCRPRARERGAGGRGGMAGLVGPHPQGLRGRAARTVPAPLHAHRVMVDMLAAQELLSL